MIRSSTPKIENEFAPRCPAYRPIIVRSRENEYVTVLIPNIPTKNSLRQPFTNDKIIIRVYVSLLRRVRCKFTNVPRYENCDASQCLDNIIGCRSKRKRGSYTRALIVFIFLSLHTPPPETLACHFTIRQYPPLSQKPKLRLPASHVLEYATPPTTSAPTCWAPADNAVGIQVCFELAIINNWWGKRKNCK